MDSSEQAAAASRETLDAEPISVTDDLQTMPLLPTVPKIRANSRAWEKSPGVGDVVGAYALLALIGEGAIGRIYLAEHTKLSRRVALKMLRPGLAENPKFVQRFFAEARAVNAIAHENIVQITDFVESADHPSFLIMELLEGQTLASLMASTGPLPFDVTRSIGMQLASALEAAHRVGIVHRDVKPDNVFLIPKISGYQVKLLDFGIAKVSDPSGTNDGKTNVGDLVGTPFYMSPEQARGWPASERSDIYAFGVLLYEMITGSRPFQGETVDEVLQQQIEAPVVPPRERSMRPEDIDPGLEQLILSCLEKDPLSRLASMDQVGDLLDALGTQTARGLSPIERSSKVLAPILILSLISFCLALGTASFLLWRSRSGQPVARVVADQAVSGETPLIRIAPRAAAKEGGEHDLGSVEEARPLPATGIPSSASLVPAEASEASAAPTKNKKAGASAKRTVRRAKSRADEDLNKPILDTETRNPFGD